ncbi:MAG: GNAT family N-acetyltransferase [Acidimicrobiales bacterium]
MDGALPQDLGDGLVLRRASPDDVEDVVAVEVAAFGASDEPGVRAALTGPGASVADWTVVTDADGTVVAASALLDHVLEVDGAPVPVSQIEYVATDPRHQRRGLVRRQVDEHHAEADRRGALATLIGGIPYFYRRFGYGYGLDFPRLVLPDPERLRPDPAVTVRLAHEADVDVLVELDRTLRLRHGVLARRTAATWRNHLSACTDAEWERIVVAERAGAPVGLAGLSIIGDEHRLELDPSLAADDGVSDALVAWMLADADARRLLPVAYVPAGTAHGARLAAIGGEVPYGLGLYVRVPDPVRLLDALRPVLSERLAASRYGARDDTVHLSLYATGVELVLSGGAVTEVLPAPGVEDPFDEVGVGIAPDWFGALVFGRWGAQGLADRIDDVTLGRRAGLMEALFPRLDADVVGVL